MQKRNITFALMFILGFLTAVPLHVNAEEGGVTTVKVESDVESRPSGKTISVKSYCPEGKTLIGGGGVCLGFMNTEDKVLLTVSAPSPDERNSWFVVCTNMNDNPGQVQAMSWAMCADSEVFEPEKKK
jgi:hypothetical protein